SRRVLFRSEHPAADLRGAVGPPRAQKKRPLAGPLLLPSENSSLLLDPEDGVFRLLRNAELHDALRGNLDLLARGRVATHAGLPVDEHELADTRDREAVL